MSDDRSCQVYIGYLPNDARMEDVEDFFKGYGKIKSVNLKPGYGFIDFEDSRDAKDAVRDLDGKRMCGEKVDIQHAKGPGNKAKDSGSRRDVGRPIVRDSRRESNRDNSRRSRSRGRRSRSHGKRRSYARHSRSRTPPRRYSPPRGSYIVDVSNISTRCRWQDLKDTVRTETKIECSFCELHMSRDREGIICFNRKDEMKDVVKVMNGFEMKGRKIELKPRNQSRSRSRSRSSRKSRSKSPDNRSPSPKRRKSDDKNDKSMSEPKDESESESKEDQNNPDSEVKNEMEKKDTGNNSADEKDENNESE